MTVHRPTIISVSLTFALACTSVPAADDEAGVTTSPSTDPTVDVDADVDASSDVDESSTTIGDDDPTLGTSSSSSTDNTDVGFVDTFEDGVWGDDYCDPFQQDCPEGEKCVPYGWNPGSWDDNKCVPIQGEQGVGDPCVYTGVEQSTDDCDGTSWCWDVDLDGNGICHAFCTGTPDMPECPPMSTCTISGSGVINICLSTCDPVIQDCSVGEACYWDGSDFSCIFMADDIPSGEPCGFINDCALGHTCVDSAALPDCNGVGCCTNFCELGLGDSQCGALPGTTCVPFFEMGQVPEGYEHVGICVLPP